MSPLFAALSIRVVLAVLTVSPLRYKAGLKEAQILNKLRLADPEDKKHIVRLERTFEHRGHLCLVFESMRLDGLVLSLNSAILMVCVSA